MDTTCTGSLVYVWEGGGQAPPQPSNSLSAPYFLADSSNYPAKTPLHRSPSFSVIHMLCLTGKKQQCKHDQNPDILCCVGAPRRSCLRPSPQYEYGKDGWPCIFQSAVHMQYRPVMYKCSCILNKI
jgi:hypothetical protein